MPTAPIIEHLAEALDVDPGELFKEPALAEKVEAPQETGLSEAERLESYLSALLAFARKQAERWERDREEKLAAQGPEFFAWSREVVDTMQTFSSAVLGGVEGAIAPYGWGSVSQAEEDYIRALLDNVYWTARFTGEIAAEWDRRADEMQDKAAAEERRRERNRLNEEHERLRAGWLVLPT